MPSLINWTRKNCIKTRYLRCFPVLVALVYLVPPQVMADPKQWVIGVEDTRYYPHFDVEDGQWRGFGAAVLEHFAQSAGYEFIYKPMPVERLFRSFVLGEVDFKYPAVAAWKPELKSGIPIYYSDPVIGYIDGLNLLEHRAGKGSGGIRSIGIVRGFSPVAWKDQISQGEIELIQGDSFRGLVRLVLLGRIDALYANVDVVSYLMSDESDLADNGYAIVFDKSLPHDRGDYRLATRQHIALIDEFNQWMEDNPDQIEKLKIEFFGALQ